MPRRAKDSIFAGPKVAVAEGPPPALDITVLGIDPGLEVTGYGLIRAVGQRWEIKDYGAVRVGQKRSLPARLCYLYEAIRDIIVSGQPSEIALEDFVVGRVRAAVAIGEARAMAVLAASQRNIPVSFYQPAEVKQTVVGYGRSSKEQVAAMVCLHLGLGEMPRPADITDALAVALCHLILRQARERLSMAVQP